VLKPVHAFTDANFFTRTQTFQPCPRRLDGHTTPSRQSPTSISSLPVPPSPLLVSPSTASCLCRNVGKVSSCYDASTPRPSTSSILLHVVVLPDTVSSSTAASCHALRQQEPCAAASHGHRRMQTGHTAAGGTATPPCFLPPRVATLFFPRRSRKRCPPPGSPPWPRAGESLSLPSPSPSSSYNTDRGQGANKKQRLGEAGRRGKQW
jgi:hypothetical protein